MSRIKHRIETADRVLSRDTLDRMHEAAVSILSRTGIAVDNAELREEIGTHSGFSAVNGRIRISPARVESWRKAGHEPLSGNPPSASDTPVGFFVSDRSLNIVDSDGSAVRPMTRADVIQWTKLITVLNDQGVHGGLPGVPTDVPIPLQPLEQFLIGAEYSPAGGATSQITDIGMAKWIREMNRVCGRKFGLSVWSPSPLILGGPELDILWYFRREVDSVCVGTMPIMGITAPCDPIATYTLAMAECIGGAVILNELLPTARISMCPHPEPADMRTGSMVMGTPEWELLDIMHRDVFAYYGQARDTKMLHTTAPVPGAQAAADHAAGALSGMLVGLRLFGPIGQLSLDEVFSPAMLLLDMDIVKHAQRIAEGVETGEGLDLDRLPSVVEEVVAGGDIFGAHETSVTNARKQYSAARTMKRRNLAQWRQHGHPCVVKEAYVEAERLVSRYAYVAPADTLNELRRIYDRAQADLK